MTIRGRVPIVVASLITAAFGVWHFFIPSAWDWYSYMSPDAPELVVAVRAINVFFSLSLVLFGAMNLALVLRSGVPRYPRLVVLVASTILWAVRVVLQLVAPQGTEIPVVRWGMLVGFVLTFGMYLVGLVATAVPGSYPLSKSRAARTPER